MDEQAIKEFWERNPCGQVLVSGSDEKINDFRGFFLKYDKFRYSTEGHTLENLDRIDFKAKSVLEIGLGQAADAQQIIDRGADYYGMDITQEACNRAALRFKIFNKPYKIVVCGDATRIPFANDCFDIIYSHGVLHHIPDIDKVAAELYRVLKKNGKLIIMLYAKNSLNYYISILFTRRILLAILLLLDKISNKRLIKKRILRKHIENAQELGLLKYLSKENFLSKNTDGPDNPYSRVYSKQDVAKVFKKFNFDSFEHYFLNQRHLPFFNIFPQPLKVFVSRKLGWHLWCYGSKK